MQKHDPTRAVLAHYAAPLVDGRMEALGAAGGFSGAQFWRIDAPTGRFCLRRWPPEHPTPQRLAFIHAVLAHVVGRGIDFVPLPLRTMKNASWIAHDGHLWELTPWLPGEADFHRDRRSAKLAAAMAALAKFHKAAEDFAAASPAGPSATVAERVDFVRELIHGGATDIRKSAEQALAVPQALREASQEILAGFDAVAPRIEPALQRVAACEFARQPVIRDVWSDHVLYVGEDVTGIIDFGAMRTDNVAVDVARLLGSLAAGEPQLWQAGLAAYEAVRPLNESERKLAHSLDVASAALSGMNWLRWIFVQQRQFEDATAVLARLNSTLERLRRLEEGTVP